MYICTYIHINACKYVLILCMYTSLGYNMVPGLVGYYILAGMHPPK